MIKWFSFVKFIEWLCLLFSVPVYVNVLLMLTLESLAKALLVIRERFTIDGIRSIREVVCTFRGFKACLLSAVILILASWNLTNSTVSLITIGIAIGLFVDSIIAFELYQIAYEYRHFEVRVRAIVNNEPEFLAAEIDGIQRFIQFTRSLNNRSL